jgi:hypothetical protein
MLERHELNMRRSDTLNLQSGARFRLFRLLEGGVVYPEERPTLW